MKFWLVLASLFIGVHAHAELGVGVLGSYHLSESYSLTSDEGLGETATGKGGYALGAIIFVPLLPELSVRTGLLYEHLRIDDGVGTSVDRVTLENVALPADLQFSIPLTDLYVFGGAVIAANYNSSSGTHMNTDVRLDAGLGYSFVTLGPLKLSGEFEYMYGITNISPNNDDKLMTRFLTFNLVGRFTL
jgi:hypothetical protein